MVITSGCRARVCSTASLPLVAVPTTLICGSALSISVTRRRKNPESSTTRTLTTPILLTAPRVAFEQPGNIQDQRYAPIAGDCRTGHPRRAMQHTTQRLDNHLFLANQLIDNEA